MLDVHAPHGKMHGAGDFFLHLLTITVGLLIAVGIEGLVEWRHHVHLAREARETMHAEIEHNAQTLDHALVQIQHEREQMQGNVDAMTKIQRNDKDPKAQDAKLSGEFNLTGLENTAWLTAQATGALTWMPYDEAERFSSMYQSQQAFEAHQDKIQEDSAIFLGLVNKVDPDKGHLTAAEAATLNERFGIWQGDLLTLDLAARVADGEAHAILEGKSMPSNIHESLRGK